MWMEAQMGRDDTMPREQALTVLRAFAAWRRGAQIPQPEPGEIGMALEVAIREMSKKSPACMETQRAQSSAW